MFKTRPLLGIASGCSNRNLLTRRNLPIYPYRTYHNPVLKELPAKYLEDIYKAWLEDPKNVHESWDSYFKQSIRGECSPFLLPASLNKQEVPLRSMTTCQNNEKKKNHEGGSDGDAYLAIQNIIRAYQFRGHLIAKLDPLELMTDRTGDKSEILGTTPDKITSGQTLTEADMDKVFKLPVNTNIGGEEKELPLREIIKRLESVYCRHIGAEYMYIDNVDQCNWIRKKLETPGAMCLSHQQKLLTLCRLIQATGFENFLHDKFPSEKRFGLEGCESMIPCLNTIIDKSTELGVEYVLLALAHRGRLNTLANVCYKPLHHIFTQFIGLKPEDMGSGDVKYHMGTYIDLINPITNKKVILSIVANPSHLEVSNGVALGRARAEQLYRDDKEGKKVMAILIHGDASYSGQGPVYETTHLTDLPAYTTHGTIHVVVNNQIGFTTDPRTSRSSPYCTCVAKVVNAPIFHVNADDPESVFHLSNIVAEWREKFHRDIVIDIVGYRKYGHNELDEPMFTQPLMYTKIRQMTPVLDKYAKQLIDEKVICEEEINMVKENYEKICQGEFDIAQKESTIKFSDWLESPWKGFFKKEGELKVCPTGVSEEVINHVLQIFSCSPPDDFIIHDGIKDILKARMELFQNKTINWVMAEACAFGSLLLDGVHVRVSGEDVERGTFKHRHHILHHQTVDKKTYCALSNLDPKQAVYTICNSSLSEFGVLSFEHGYSMACPNCLVMWEAQFGDFGNGAQTVIDTMICSGETKWVRQSGVILSLPHGHEGQGPEHSSARLERFLQLTDEDADKIPDENEDTALNQLHHCNWIVANCTTPANYFHILRRQIALPFRKPLVLMMPKTLLRHPECVSSFDEIVDNTEFQRVLPDCGAACQNADNVKRLIFCSGKIFYELRKLLKEKCLDEEIAVCRIEQLAPFPFDLIKKECEKYSTAEICWCQEEHKNQGAFYHVLPRLNTILSGQRNVTYIGRGPSAASATGNKYIFKTELQDLYKSIVEIKC